MMRIVNRVNVKGQVMLVLVRLGVVGRMVYQSLLRIGMMVWVGENGMLGSLAWVERRRKEKEQKKGDGCTDADVNSYRSL